jgi:hypothetical protein
MKKRLAAILKWLAIFILALAVIYAGLMIWSAHKLRQAYAALEKDGRPMDLSQVIPSWLEKMDNAAPVYQAAIQLLGSKKVASIVPERKSVLVELYRATEAFLVDQATPESAAAAATLRKWFKDPVVAMILREVETATAKPCRYYLDYSQGSNMRVEHLGSNKMLMTILCAKARLLAADGDAAAAWDTAICSLHFADASKNEPILISQLVRIAEVWKGLETIQYLARTSLPSPTQQKELDEAFKSFNDVKPLVLAMDGERLQTGEWIFNLSLKESLNIFSTDILSLGPPIWLPQSKIGGYAVYFSPLFQYDHAVYVDLMRQHAQAASQPYSPETLRQIEACESVIPGYCVWSRALRSSFSQEKNTFTRFYAQTAVIRAGLAVLRYKQANDAYPQSLVATGLTEIADPFTQKPLIYKLAEKGFLVYSVGQNLKDDGGTAIGGINNFPLDIAWEYKAP